MAITAAEIQVILTATAAQFQEKLAGAQAAGDALRHKAEVAWSRLNRDVVDAGRAAAVRRPGRPGTPRMIDATIVGSGPNGLAAAVTLALGVAASWSVGGRR